MNPLNKTFSTMKNMIQISGSRFNFNFVFLVRISLFFVLTDTLRSHTSQGFS